MDYHGFFHILQRLEHVYLNLALGKNSIINFSSNTFSTLVYALKNSRSLSFLGGPFSVFVNEKLQILYFFLPYLICTNSCIFASLK